MLFIILLVLGIMLSLTLTIWALVKINKEGYGKILSDHQRFPVPSPELKEYNENMLKELALFHHFCNDNDIIYTLFAGSLIGYYWNKRPIAWDDDIDVLVRDKDFQKIRKLWKQGKNERKSRDNRFMMKDIVINNTKLFLLKNKYNSGWFKLKLGDNSKWKDIGGLDIEYAFIKNNKIHESINKHKLAPGPVNTDTEKECPEVVFGGVKTRAIIYSRGKKYLDKVYGKKWIIKKHPSLEIYDRK